MPAIRSTNRNASLVALVAIAMLSVAALGAGMVRTPPAGARAALALPDTLAFDVEYDGIGSQGVDLIWRGLAAGPVPAQVTMRMEYAGGQADRAMPVWPVNVWLFFCADDYRSSFAAELSGSINWRNGEMRVIGLVSDGVRVDASLEQRVLLRRPGLSGFATLVFLPRVALSDAMALGY